MKDIATIIMGGGQGSRLYPLTRDRAKPAVPVAGRMRLIDVPLSNCINSDLMRIYVLTQFNSGSLNRHISRTYNFGSLLPASVEVIAADLTVESRDWFQGTADAVRRSLRHVLSSPTRLIMILAGDHLYRMDYRPFIERHESSGADVTLAACPVSEQHASSFGLVHCDAEGLVTAFSEKPSGAVLEAMRIDPTAPLAGGEAAGAPYLASMGIYIFSTEILEDLLAANPSHHDFGREIIPDALENRKVAVHLFRGYWEDIGTISAFYRANLALASTRQYQLYNPDYPLYTRPRYLSPTRIDSATIEGSLIAEGSLIGEARIRRSVVGIRSRIGDGVDLEGVLVMGNDNYESEAERQESRDAGIPGLGIGSGTVIRKAIIDKGARIGRNVRILNESDAQEYDGHAFFIRDGIVIVPRLAVIPDDSVI